MKILDNIKTQIVNPFIMLLLGVALLVFLYGLLEFLLNKDSASKNRQELYDKMIWGAVGLAVMVSVFGIMQFVIDTLKTLTGSS